MNQKSKLTKKQRVINFFLDAAASIVEESGIDSITIRNVSERAGYNSATLYNYFENLDHLIAFTVIRYVSVYLTDVSQRIVDITDDPFHVYANIWECLCIHTFRNPEIFEYAYASTPEKMNNVQSHISDYLEVFPETIAKVFDKKVLLAFFATTYAEHDEMIVRPFIEMHLFSEEASKKINYYGTTLYNGLLNKAINLKDKSPEEYTQYFMDFFLPFLKDNLE